MTISLFSEPEPTPEESAPGSRRRLWIILGSVLALLLFAASATYLLVYTGHSGPSATPPGAYSPPAGLDSPSDTPSDQASAGPSGSAGPSAGHSAGASPGKTGTPGPTGGVPAPVSYRVAGNLCPSVDLTELKSAAGQPTGAPTDDHGEKSNYTDYTCTLNPAAGGSAAVIRIEAMIFADAGSAATSFESSDKTASGIEPVGGVGSQAVGSTGTSNYYLVTQDGNLKFKIWVSTSSAAVRQAAINTARATLPKLRG
jgi:hypothetical protein